MHNYFFIPYSPNFYSNNLAGNKYRVIGGEAYKWDFNIPETELTQGEHFIDIYNRHSLNYNISVIGFEVYEIINLY